VAGQIHCIDYDGNSHRLAVGIGDMVQIATETTEGAYQLALSHHLKQSFQILGKLSGSFRIYPPDDVSCVGDDKRVRPRALHFYQRGTKVIVTYLNHGVVYVVKVQCRALQMSIDAHYILELGTCRPVVKCGQLNQLWAAPSCKLYFCC